MSGVAAELSELLGACIDFGPLGIAGLGIAEKLLPFVPSYVAFVMIGVVVAAKHGNLALAALALAIGSTAGSLCWYSLGRSLGDPRSRAFVARFGRYIGLTPGHYEYAARAFRQEVFLIITVCQTIPGIRIYAAIPAGVLGTSLAPFLLPTLIGSLLWSGALLTLGFWIGDSTENPASSGLIAVTALLGFEAVVLFGWRRFRRLWPARAAAPGVD